MKKSEYHHIAQIEGTGYIEDFVNYTLDGNKIIKEETCGTNHYSVYYYYDSNDNVIGFMYNNDKYMYLKNLQNDVIGIVDSNNNIVVKYYYDGYGRTIKTVDTSGINLGEINPFRYRSYYQDNETGWYYLNSRYYDPITGRFVTMDQIEYLGYTGSVLSYNLYTYCEGNPVIYVDYSGEWLELLITVAVIAVSVVIILWATEIASRDPLKQGRVQPYVEENMESFRPSIDTISRGGSFGNYLAEDDPVGNILKINSIG